MVDFFAYDANSECENCDYGKAVTTEDFAIFHICFIPHTTSRKKKSAHGIRLK